MKAREGDLLKSQADVIFDVKGLVHPSDRIVAFPRYISEPNGCRMRNGATFKKIYALRERYDFLEKFFPSYIVNDPIFGDFLSEVPKNDVKHLYSPQIFLKELRDFEPNTENETRALHLLGDIQKCSHVQWNKLGISGSLLVRLSTSRSDIDLIAYGEKNCSKVYKSMKTLMEDANESPRPYTVKELKILYDFRSQDTEMSFEKFVLTDGRKVLQGKYQKKDFYIRCIKDWNEVDESYGDITYRRSGYARLKATVSDDTEAIFTPCRYLLEDVQPLEGEHCEEIKEIVSFRGRFCEQAKKGETVTAQGKVERLENKDGDISFRLLLGNNRSDFMVPVD